MCGMLTAHVSSNLVIYLKTKKATQAPLLPLIQSVVIVVFLTLNVHN